MKRLLVALWLVLLAVPLHAQIMTPSPQFVNAVSSGVTVCTSGNCAVWTIPNTAPSITSQITGTLTSLTLTAEGTTDGQSWFPVVVTNLATGAAATTTTATGQFVALNTGLVGFRWRCTTYASGAANISLTRGAASSALRSFSTPSFPSFTAGDLLYASAANVVSGLNDVATGQVLASGGVGVVPAYTASPTIGTSVTTPILYGGSGATSTLALRSTSGVGTTDEVRIGVGTNGATSSAVFNHDGSTTFTKLMSVGQSTSSRLIIGQQADFNLGSDAGTASYISITGGSTNAGLNMATTSTTNGASTGHIDFGSTGTAGGEKRGWSIHAPLVGSAAANITSDLVFYGTNAGSLAERVRFTAAGAINTGGLAFASLAVSGVAPTIASGGCTSPAVTHSNGTAAFLLTLGSSCAGVKTLVLTLPAAAHFWACDAQNNTSDAQQAANTIASRATSTTAVTLTNYARTTGLALDYTAADTLLVKCSGE